ncbi:MAG: hypothetical protein L0Z71_02885 [Anaerolineae bacterium]|nr:hypothetical protein [Anaerolineae bacterium]
MCKIPVTGSSALNDSSISRGAALPRRTGYNGSTILTVGTQRNQNDEPARLAAAVQGAGRWRAERQR